MSEYRAPVEEMMFTAAHVAGLERVRSLPGFEDVSSELVQQILQEAGKLGSDILAPLNGPGDREGAVLENGAVRMPNGFAEAYQSFIDGGWNGMPFPEDVGGQGLPWLVATAASEIWHSANMSFGLCPMLTGSAIELLLSHGSDDIKATYLPHLVAGTWTGTMNLTEPQAGSDLSLVGAKAVPDGDIYRISGQKIFITYGDHDMAENIVHMVLARTPDAPPGVKGISLFVVPKFLIGENGALGDRNDLRAGSLEHKLGINASPTAVMLFGEDGGAVGYLVGEENRGLEYMFTMMNNARLAVGLEGVAIAERAYQRARAYAVERRQGRTENGKDTAAIIEHADVKRMLLAMRAQTEAARTLAYWVAGQLDMSKKLPDTDARAEALSFVDLLTPVVKAWCTDAGVAVADLGVQVHGGMGYIEETGAAQHLRDARIAPIYEGTNGIQALDLAGRKVIRDGGTAMTALITRMRASISEMPTTHAKLNAAVDALEDATAYLVESPNAGAANAVPYLRLTGITVAGWLMVEGFEKAKATQDQNPGFAARKVASVRYVARFLLPEAPMLASVIKDAGTMIADCPADDI